MNKFTLTVFFFLAFGTLSLAQDCKGKLVDGKKQGLWKCYYEDGVLQEEGKYKDDLKTGKWKIYHANGELALEGTYVEGVEKGEWVMYDDFGRKLDVIDYGS